MTGSNRDGGWIASISPPSAYLAPATPARRLGERQCLCLKVNGALRYRPSRRRRDRLMRDTKGAAWIPSPRSLWGEGRGEGRPLDRRMQRGTFPHAPRSRLEDQLRPYGALAGGARHDSGVDRGQGRVGRSRACCRPSRSLKLAPSRRRRPSPHSLPAALCLRGEGDVRAADVSNGALASNSP